MSTERATGRLSPERISEICDLYRKGIAVSEIIDITGCAYTTVWRVIQTHNPPREDPQKPEKKQKPKAVKNQDEINRMNIWARKHGKTYGHRFEIMVPCRNCDHYNPGTCKYVAICKFSEHGELPYMDRPYYRGP